MPRRWLGDSTEAQRRHPDGVARGFDVLLECDVLVTELRGGDFDLKLLFALTPDGHIGDTRNADQPRLDLPSGQDGHFDA